MSRFTDGNGREWALRLTVGALSDVKSDTGFDLGTAIKSEQGLADLLFSDPAQLVSILWVLCEPVATARGVTPEDFARLFDGVTLGSAGEALLMAIADFFPRSRVGAAIKSNLQATLDRLDNLTIERINSISSSGPGNLQAS